MDKPKVIIYETCPEPVRNWIRDHFIPKDPKPYHQHTFDKIAQQLQDAVASLTAKPNGRRVAALIKWRVCGHTEDARLVEALKQLLDDPPPVPRYRGRLPERSGRRRGQRGRQWEK